MALRLGRETVRLAPMDTPLELLHPPHANPLERDPVEWALDHPIGSRRLEEVVRASDRVLIVISDATRSTAADRVVPALLERLGRAGVPDRSVQYAVACGLHPPPSDPIAAGLIGEAAQRIQRAELGREGDDFVLLGTTTRGTPVRVHRVLQEADVVILTGAVGFHYYAGFTGGRKAVLPGLAAPDAIAANHLLALDPERRKRDPRAATGRIEDNPVHLDMEEACARVDPSFLVNVSMAGGREVEFAVAGHWREAHGEACRRLLGRRTVAFQGPRDLVVVSAGGHPWDIDLIQAHKAMEAALPLVHPGGAMVVLAECPNGVGHPQMERWLDGRSAADLGEALSRGYEVYGQTAHALRTKAEAIDILLISSLDDAVARRAGLRPVPTLEAALEQLEGRIRSGYVLESGAHVLPVPREPSVDRPPQRPLG